MTNTKQMPKYVQIADAHKRKTLRTVPILAVSGIYSYQLHIENKPIIHSAVGRNFHTERSALEDAAEVIQRCIEYASKPINALDFYNHAAIPTCLLFLESSALKPCNQVGINPNSEPLPIAAGARIHLTPRANKNSNNPVEYIVSVGVLYIGTLVVSNEEFGGCRYYGWDHTSPAIPAAKHYPTLEAFIKIGLCGGLADD